MYCVQELWLKKIWRSEVTTKIFNLFPNQNCYLFIEETYRKLNDRRCSLALAISLSKKEEFVYYHYKTTTTRLDANKTKRKGWSHVQTSVTQ